jgi:hypothetical protein
MCMENTCKRCNQTLQDGNCYCPTCGLPQLIYEAEIPPGQTSAERRNPVRDADSVAWKPALRTAVMLAVPAGLLCSMLSPVSILGVVLMAATASWVVLLYVRSQGPAWLTTGAGARIGLVTGLLGGWTAAAATAVTLFSMRYLMHNGKFWDDFVQTIANQFKVQEQSAPGVDQQQVAGLTAWLLSPEGRAGWTLGILSLLVGALLLSAVAGGALGARLLARTRRPQA